MGQEIDRADFAAADFTAFAARLADETALARTMFAARAFSETGYSLGYEIEAWLLDHAYYPNPVNEAFLAAMHHPLVVPELSRFNVELNSLPAPLADGVFSRMAADLSDLWARCERVAHGLDTNIVAIGTLPVIRDQDLRLENISPLKRYYALNHEVLRRRGGRPVRIAITGHGHPGGARRDALSSEHRDVMLEAATTSFQIHLKPPASRAHLYWNASAIIAGPLLAASGNAPFLFGKDLWDETRIPLFEQAVDLPGCGDVKRVGFGDRYVASLLELFGENVAKYPVLLPLAFDEPPSALRHLALHNGTIWRWNRPLIGFDDGGAPHLRIEHRILPAGPSIADMIANTAFYVGAVHELVERGAADPDHPALPFADARENFYAGARGGLDAEMAWPEGNAGNGRAARVPARALLLDRLIPMARTGLQALGVASDGDDYIDLFEERVRNGRTGAVWQRASAAANGGDFTRMMAAYCERQRSGAPVYQWLV